MFNKMILSTNEARSRRLTRFFVGSSVVYVLVLAAALVLSVLVSDPKLTGTMASTRVFAVGPPTQSPPLRNAAPHSGGSSAAGDYRHPMTFDQVTRQSPSQAKSPLPPPGLEWSPLPPGDEGVGSGAGHNPGGGGIGPIGQGIPLDPPPNPVAHKPDPIKDQPAVNKPIRVSGSVMQGRAIVKITPPYPPLAKAIHLEGSADVEVLVSPEGRVLSVRGVSGHPTLLAAAKEAARGWVFRPTLLGNVPVGVTSLITFVFKLN